MESNDRIMHVWMSILYVLVGVLGSVTILILGWLPGARARARSHSSARAIAMLGWASLIAWPLWPIAMVWASSRCYRRARAVVRIRVTSAGLTPTRPPIAGSLKLVDEPKTRTA